MKNRVKFICCLPCLILLSCGISRKDFQPDRKYSPAQLQTDYRVFRGTLEAWHPSLYWYTPKDSMDRYFDEGYAALKDSMTEPEFRKLLSFVIARVRCGHTSIEPSKSYAHYLDTARLRQFPLILKFWADTMVVISDLNRHDPVLKRGTLIYSIDGRTARQLTDTIFPYLVTDGYNRTGKYQYLSSGLHFSSWYKDLFGEDSVYHIRYRDTSGAEREEDAPLYDPRADTVRWSLGRELMPGTGQKRPGVPRRTRPSRRRRKARELLFTRTLDVDTASHSAFLTLNTFEHGYHLKPFFRATFRTLREKKVKNLVIDVRTNGGGDAGISTMLTRYLINRKFKIADSLYTIRRFSRYDSYIQHGLIYDMLSYFTSRRRSDGFYHFRHFERHYYSPVARDHFDGQIYILTGGYSFSATCLFAGALKGQSNVTLVGEETGGGYYGNTAWMIPDVTLPVTGVRFRLPRYRLVVDSHRVKDGRGVMPDVPALPSVEALIKGIDFKTAKVRELIRLRSAEGVKSAESANPAGSANRAQGAKQAESGN
ncbi:MAG TPA: S41 family peptidase [Puia sp.]|nr:S41 family peptidase [Puia sp.]